MGNSHNFRIFLALAVGVTFWTGFQVKKAYAQQTAAPPNMPKAIDFNWDVRPILSDHCFRCHGPDSKSRKAGLRLDDVNSAYLQAIDPGNPGDSEMIRRIISKDPKYQMPPGFSGAKAVSDADIATLKEWIKQGAEYKPHWAFIPPVKTVPPQATPGDRVANDIDRFVVARLKQAGVQQSPEADRATLINRVSLTLTGLPPSLEEVAAFVKDKDPSAYEKLVDKLLASPAYGEHMASYWLDAARFAESDGFLDDHHDRLLWPWRDWVISAFNNNMRFDQFTTWQLAGDLLPNRTREQLLATAFLRVGKRTTENGAIDEEYRVESALDKTETVGKVFLGLTVGCARCHDHKYDPIPQKDYYSLSGFFNSTDEPGVYAPGFSAIQGGPTLAWTDAAADAKLSAAAAEIRNREKTYQEVREMVLRETTHQVHLLLSKSPSEAAARLQKSLQDSAAAYYSFDKTTPFSKDLAPPLRKQQPPPTELVSLKRRQAAGTKPPAGLERARSILPNGMKPELSVLLPNEVKDGNYGVAESATLKPGVKGHAFYFNDTNRAFLGKDVGWYERTHAFTLDFWLLAAKQYEDSTVINHMEEQNSGSAGYTVDLENNLLRFRLQHSWPFNMISVMAKQAVPVNQWLHLSITYDGSSRASGVKMYFNGQPADLEIERDNLTRTILPMDYGRSFDAFAGLAFGKRFRKTALVGGAIDEVRVYDRALDPLEVSFLHDEAGALKLDPHDLQAKLTDVMVDTDPRVVAAMSRLSEARESQNKIISLVPEVLVMGDTPTPRPTYRLNRGVYNQHAEEVPVQGLQQIFPYSKDLPRNRLGLAKWLLDENNPLTARVFVNRLWQQDFGEGLVDTPQDFGSQGSKPTHPQLLDWLAVQFRESGWDIKAMQKLIVMSATYRQTSDASDELIQKDPENKLLARGIRQRMSAEMVRDKALAISGLLVTKIGGPSVHPYQPSGIWEGMGSFYPYPKPDEIPAEEQHRRTLYTFVKRNAPHPEMAVFDFVDRNSSAVNRNISNSPLQALAMLDDPQFVEAYRVLATNAMKSSADRDAQFRLIYRLAARRNANEDVMAVMSSVYEEASRKYRDAKPKALALIRIGVTPVDQSVDPIQLAALTDVVAVVMNTPDAYSIR